MRGHERARPWSRVSLRLRLGVLLGALAALWLGTVTVVAARAGRSGGDVTGALALAGVLGAVLLATLAGVLGHDVLGPLARLQRHVERVGAGEVDHQVPGRGPDEVARLAEGIEAMRVRLVEEQVRVGESNDALAMANRELLRSNAELEELAYVASHDLSEPLRVIAGFSQLLAADHADQLDEGARAYLDHIVTGVARMRSLLDGLLAVARVGRADLEPRRVDLNDVLVDVRHDLGAAIHEAGASVVVRDLPVVEGDPRQLRQLFQNLLSNAIKYHQPDVAPVIDLSATDDDGSLAVVVADNGLGIDPRHRERVFGMFKRLHSLDRFPGNGIGLAVCRRIAERHGASIHIEANAPVGTRVVVRFPRSGPGLPTAAPTPARHTSSPSIPR